MSYALQVVGSSLDNIPGPPSTSLINGNIGQLFNPRQSWEFLQSVRERYGRAATLHGMFGEKILYTYDPRALHSIYVKEQDVYEENELLLTSFGLFLGPGLLAMLGDQHRRQRKMLNPLFSAKHLRDMTPIFYNVIHKLESAIASRVGDDTKELDILGWMGRTALELIGQGGLGHSFDPLTEDRPDEFAAAVKSYFPVQGQLNTLGRQLLPVLVHIGPAWIRRKVVEMLPEGPAQKMRRISDALAERSAELVNAKKRALQQGDEAVKLQVGEGKDIMSVLLRENMKASDEDRLTDEELIAQVSTLTLAAMDTTSNALSRILQMLSTHPQVQDKLREELVQARDDGSGNLRDLDYDEVMELPYLDAVCRETLRRFPPTKQSFSSVRKEAVLPLSGPIRTTDGKFIDGIPVKKGVKIVTDVRGSNCNKELWGQDAEEWKPERWLKPLPPALEAAHIPGVYSHLMTFIGGARACIGFKFSQLEMKIVLATLIPSFRFELTGKPISWNASGVAYPSVGESKKPEMPLLVTRLNAY
ncbi:cytochrome P450 [Trametes polyzona]|nr:cytochrome P450 [Trametes polyzona]